MEGFEKEECDLQRIRSQGDLHKDRMTLHIIRSVTDVVVYPPTPCRSLEKCLEILIKTNRLPEAAFLARTYLPSHVSRYCSSKPDCLSV